MQHISRLAKLWVPLDKRIVLQGVHSNNTIIRNEPEWTLQLGRDWQRTFDRKPFPISEATEFLAEGSLSSGLGGQYCVQ